MAPETYSAVVYPGLLSLGVPGVPWHTHILADQLTLFQPGGTDYAHLITTGPLRFSDLRTALQYHISKSLYVFQAIHPPLKLNIFAI